MIILVLNCGSSSLKYQLLDMKNEEVYDLLAKGLVERIGMEVGCLKHQAEGKEKLVKEMPIEDHTVGIKAVLDALLDKEYGVLSTLEDIEAVGHRVVHGAEEFVCSQLITDEVVAQLEKCSVFAPLHNPANILGIKAVSAVLPTVPQVGVFLIADIDAPCGVCRRRYTNGDHMLSDLCSYSWTGCRFPHYRPQRSDHLQRS